MTDPSIRPISAVLTDLIAAIPESEKICVMDLMQALHERGFGFLLLIFALPMALPVPVPPGINILLAAPLLCLTAQQAMGRRAIWLPSRLKYKSLSRARFESILKASLPWIKRIEFLVRPRLGFMTHGLFSHLIGILGFIMALSVCIPLPLTNTVPSLGIALMAVGVIMRDGLAVIAGALIGSAWVALLTLAFIFFGMEGFDMVKEFIKGLF